MVKRLGIDLLKNPTIKDIGDMPHGPAESPFDKALDTLTVQEGPPMELMTRANPRLINAATVAYTMIKSFDSDYIRGKIGQIMRLAVSQNGRGRQEIVDSLKAGASAVAIQAFERNQNYTFREAPEE